MCARCRPARSKRSRSAWASCTRCGELGVVVWNDARAIERCVDKSMTSFLLAPRRPADARRPGRWNPPKPRARSSNAKRRPRAAGAQAAVRRAGQGLAAHSTRRTTCPRPEEVAGVYYLQRFAAERSAGLHAITALFVLRRPGDRGDDAPRARPGSPMSSRAANPWPSRAIPRWSVSRSRRREAVGADIAGVDVIVGRRRRADRARGQQHAGLERPAKGEQAQYRRGDRVGADGRARPRVAARRARMSAREDRVAAAYIEACLAELDAPKPGNVHRFAAGHGMKAADFVRSAEASAGPIARQGRAGRSPRPRRCRGDAHGGRPEHQSRHHPAVRAARGGRGELPDAALRAGARRVCSMVSIATDARATSSPPSPPPIPAASGARPSTTCTHPPTVDAARGDGGGGGAGPDRAAVCHGLRGHFRARPAGAGDAPVGGRATRAGRRSPSISTFLAAIPDTHIARKFGAATAEAVRREAADWRAAFAATRDPA